MPSGGTAGCASLNIPYLASSLVLSASGLCININIDRSSAFDEEVDSGSAWASFELKLIFSSTPLDQVGSAGREAEFSTVEA